MYLVGKIKLDTIFDIKSLNFEICILEKERFLTGITFKFIILRMKSMFGTYKGNNKK